MGRFNSGNRGRGGGDRGRGGGGFRGRGGGGGGFRGRGGGGNRGSRGGSFGGRGGGGGQLANRNESALSHSHSEKQKNSPFQNKGPKQVSGKFSQDMKKPFNKSMKKEMKTKKEEESDEDYSSADEASFEASGDEDFSDKEELKRLLGHKGGDDSDDDSNESVDEESDDSEEAAPPPKKAKVHDDKSNAKQATFQKKDDTKPTPTPLQKSNETAPALSKNQMKKLKKQKVSEPNLIKTTEVTTVSHSATSGSFSLKNLDGIKKESLRRREEVTARSVYIRPIPSHCTPGMLKELARESVGVQIPTSMKKKSKGFAFLEFRSSDVAQKQISILNGKLFCEKNIIAAKATGGTRPLSDDLNLLSLFILGLNRETKPADLQLLFTNASKVKVDALPDGECLGTAVVEFTSEADALNAFVQNHNKPVRGKPICVSYSFKDSKDTVNKPSDSKPIVEQTRKRQHSESSVNSSPVKSLPSQSPAEPQTKKVKVTTPLKPETPKTPQTSKADSTVKKTPVADSTTLKTPTKESSSKKPNTPAKLESESKKGRTSLPMKDAKPSKNDESEEDSEEEESSDLDAEALQALMDSDNNNSSDEDDDEDDDEEDEEDDEDDDDDDDDSDD